MEVAWQDGDNYMKLLKNCWKCGLVKELTEFYIRKDSGKPRGECKKCCCIMHSEARAANRKHYSAVDRNSKLKRKFGIDQSQYLLRLMDQSSRCAICNTHTSKLKKVLYVDHSHETGKVRKLLCDLCNRSLGYFKDNQSRLLSAIEYLKETA